MTETLAPKRIAKTERSDIEREVVAALARTMRIPESEVHPGSKLEAELGLDSLGMINVSIALEEKFQIVLNPCEEEQGSIVTVDDLVSVAFEKSQKECA